MENLTTIFKSKSGIYQDTPENRRLHRVGQHYGSTPEEDLERSWAKRAAALKIKGLDPTQCESIDEFAGSKKRKALREKLISETVAKSVKSGEVGKAIFALGGAASGKSSSLRVLGYSEAEIPCQINPDNFQEGDFQKDNMFYNRTDKQSGARRLHEETSLMAKEVYRRVLDQGGDFVKDGVMSDYEKAVKEIEKAEAAGYSPQIVGVTVPIEVALERSRQRYIDAERNQRYSGRFVPEDVIKKGHIGSVNTFVRLYLERKMPDMVLFDNNVPLGQKPIMIFDSKKKPPILDDERMKAFLLKGGLQDKYNELMKRKDDLVKSLDNNKGKTIHSILEKYWFQRRGVTPISGEAWAENEEERKHYKEHFDWENDGKDTGIANDEMFFELQKRVYGKIIYPLWL